MVCPGDVVKLYFQAVRRWWTVLAAIVLLGRACWLIGGTEVPVPGFLGNMIGTQVRYFTPLLVVVAVLYCLSGTWAPQSGQPSSASRAGTTWSSPPPRHWGTSPGSSWAWTSRAI